MTKKPVIGEPRIYAGGTVPILYPGETATAHVDPEAVMAALARGEDSVPVRDWTVEPAPGWHAWWLRLRYRVWGRWFASGAPQIETKATMVSKDTR